MEDCPGASESPATTASLSKQQQPSRTEEQPSSSDVQPSRTEEQPSCMDEPAQSAAEQAAGDQPAAELAAEPGRKKSTWKKYGQKRLRGKSYTGMKMMRCYYRCVEPGCQVKKQVEISAWSTQPAEVTVIGEQPPSRRHGGYGRCRSLFSGSQT